MNIERLMHRRVGEALRRHNMIEHNDRVLIAVSGGKDSTALARLLAEKRRYLPIEFTLQGCHAVTDLTPRSAEAEAGLDDFFAKLEVPLARIFVPVLGRLDKDKSMNCFFCAMQRRKALLGQALKHGCNKIAYGHHLDDIIETLLMNMFYKAEISTMPARLELDHYDVVIIRPLCLAKEREVATYSKRFALTEAGPPCPYGVDGRRARVKKLVSELAAEDERIRDNISASLGRVKLGYLQEKIKTRSG